ncbi:MAG: PAS domain S-box protein, partial [Phycisphaerae bacterium]
MQSSNHRRSEQQHESKSDGQSTTGSAFSALDSRLVESSIRSAFLDQLDDALFLTNDIFQIAWANPAGQLLLGAKQEALDPTDIRALLSVPDEVVAALGDVNGQQQRFRFESPNLLATANDTCFEVSVSRIAIPSESVTEENDAPAARQIHYTFSCIDRTEIRDSRSAASAAMAEIDAFRAATDEHCLVSITNRRGRIIDANPAFCEISGYSREELLGKDHRILNSGVHPKEFWIDAWNTITSGKVWRGEVCNRAKDGSLYWVDSTIVPRLGSDGKPVGFVSIRVDITARKVAEADAAAFRAATEEHCLVSIADRTGRIIEANSAFCRISGYERDELIGKDHRLLNSGFHPREFWIEMWKDISSGKPWRGEVCNRAKDGSIYWVDSTIVPHIGADGLPEKFVSIRVDITSRKNAEADAAVLRAATEEHSIVSITDRQGKIIEANSGFTRISGYSRSELLGKDHRILNSGIHPKTFWVNLWKTISSGKPWRGEVCNRNKDGSLYWVDSTIVPHLGPDGSPEKYVSIRIDITRRKAAEQEAARAAKLLDAQLAAIDRSQCRIEFSPDGVVLSANTNFLQLLGYEQYELLGKHDISMVTPEEGQSQEYKDFWNSLRTGDFQRGEFLRVTKSGERRWIHAIYNPVFTLEGCVEKIAMYATDV